MTERNANVALPMTDFYRAGRRSKGFFFGFFSLNFNDKKMRLCYVAKVLMRLVYKSVTKRKVYECLVDTSITAI